MHPERSLFIFGARVSIAAIDVIPSSRNAFAGKASVMSEVTVNNDIKDIQHVYLQDAKKLRPDR